MIKKIYKKLTGIARNRIRRHKLEKKFKADFELFRKEVESAEYACPISEPKAAAVLLSYKRPRNLPWIAKSLLKNDFVERVIVSNNNPEMSMEDWFDFSDSRLQLVNQDVRRRAGYRYEIAKDLTEEYYIFIDDDLFLLPSQIAALYRELLKNPGPAHGVWGQRFYKDGDGFSWKSGFSHFDGELDVINRAYFLTRRHVDNFIWNLHELGIERVVDLKFGDDMILSFSGEKRPLCHDVGLLIDCPTKDSDDIAIWKENEFFDYRSGLYERLLAIRELSSRSVLK